MDENIFESDATSSVLRDSETNFLHDNESIVEK